MSSVVAASSVARLELAASTLKPPDHLLVMHLAPATHELLGMVVA
ncbi:hypothetical protein XGA_4028 [Xanthomonas hortorum ATCC 19865]|nr:hypothetical protein XGA_4028 [Xanthomonas hortorum ATCC 19865]